MTTTDRMPGESAVAYAAFKTYCQLGATRSLPKVRQELSKSLTLLKRWSKRWHWQTRSALWDNQQSHTEQSATEQAELELARVRAARREMIQERSWAAAQKLIDKAMAMLEFPVGRQEKTETQDGKEVTIVAMPGDWKFGDAAAMLKTADGLARLSLGMATGKQEISGPDDKPFMIPGPAMPTQLIVNVTHGEETERAVEAFGPRPDGR